MQCPGGVSGAIVISRIPLGPPAPVHLSHGPPAFKNHPEGKSPGLSQSPSELGNPVLSACPALFPPEFLEL